MEALKELIRLVLDKEELKTLDAEFAADLLKRVAREELLRSFKNTPLKQFKRSAEFKSFLKEARSLLRQVYGAFFLEKPSRIEKKVEELLRNPSLKNHEAVLKCHRSSKERLPYYAEVYKAIFGITGIPESILDLAAGLNPFSYPWLGCKPLYQACEVSPFLCGLVKHYFEEMGVEGGCSVANLLRVEELSFNQSFDVCFLFKTLDSLEAVERGVSEKLLDVIPVRFVAASFPTKSLGGSSKISTVKRRWLQGLLEEMGCPFETFIEGDEFFIVAKLLGKKQG